MVTDARKHLTIAPGEKPTRAALAAALLSISDVVPVSGATEQTQVAQALQAAGVSLASAPLVTARADASPMHRIEYSYDGNVFLPASGVLHFATETAANSWASANSAYLTLGDRCFVGATAYVWQGGPKWRLAALSGNLRASPGGFSASTMTQVAVVGLPESAPAGRYVVNVSSITAGASVGPHYQRVIFGGVELTNTSEDRMDQQPANVDVSRSDSLLTTHPGGAADVSLAVQVNATTPVLRAARLTVMFVG